MTTPDQNQDWQDIPGYEGLYSITKDGRVWSHRRKTVKGGWRKLSVTWAGYLYVQLSKNGKYHGSGVHRLVALTYISNPNNLPQVNHMNGNKQDNRVENLEWCDGAYNQQHSRKTGLYQHQAIGSKHGSAKLAESQVREMRQLKGMSYKQIGDLYGVHPTTASAIIRKKEWSWLN